MPLGVENETSEDENCEEENEEEPEGVVKKTYGRSCQMHGRRTG